MEAEKLEPASEDTPLDGVEEAETGSMEEEIMDGEKAAGDYGEFGEGEEYEEYEVEGSDEDEEEEEDEEEGEEGEEEEDDEGDEEEEEEEDGEEEVEEEEEEEGGEEDDEEWETLDDSEKCPVCLDSFVDKDVGNPESCDHIFCLDCILEWSRNINTCPVDRSLFRSILVRHSVHGEVVRNIEVAEHKTNQRDGDGDDATYCEVCGRCDREDRLLLCDGCDAGYHCECLDPPLVHIPIEEWYCPECVAQNRHQEDQSSEEEMDIAEPSSPDQTRERPVTRHRRRETREPPAARAIARTHVSALVLARISRARAAERQQSGASSSAVNRRKPVRRKTKKRKTVRKRKTVKKRKTSKLSTATGKTLVKRRKVKRRKRGGGKKRVTKAALPPSIRSRIAGKLQLVKPRTGSMMPDMKVKGQQSLGFRRHEIGAATLRITGSDLLLDDSEEASTSRVSVPAKPPSGPQFVSSSSTPDLLGAIFSGQDMLHMTSRDVTIHRDGSLTRNSQDSVRDPQTHRQSSFESKKEPPRETPSGTGTGTETSEGPDGRSEGPRSPTEPLAGREVRANGTRSPKELEAVVGEVAETRPRESGGNRDPDSDEEDGGEVEGEEDGGEDGGAVEEEEDGQVPEEIEEEEEEVEEEEEEEDADYGNQPSDAEKTSGKHDGSITCQVSSSSFEESDEEGIIDERRPSSRKRRGSAEPRALHEGAVTKRPSCSRGATAHGNGLSARGDESRKSHRRKSSVEEGLIEEEGDQGRGGRKRSRTPVSEEEGLIPDEDYSKRTAERRPMLHSDEEGLIPDEEDMRKTVERHEVIPETTAAKSEPQGGEQAGHSSAEEGEVKTDDEEGSASARKKRKRERRRQRNRKDTRTVVIDSELSLAVPKRPLAEVLSARKMAPDALSTDSAASREREYDRGDVPHPPEPGVFSDLRHVIQVKREVPQKRPSRYEAYWAELERQRAIETQMVEKAAVWEHHGAYDRPYPYEEDWNRMILARKPLEPQWENFTIHRERSPPLDWRKDREGLEERVEAERRIEMVPPGDHDRRIEAKRRGEAEPKPDAEHRLPERKLDARKEHDRDKKADPKAGSRKADADGKGRSDRKREAEPARDPKQKEPPGKPSHKADASRRKSANPETEDGRRGPHEAGKKSSSRAEPEKDSHGHRREREKREKHKKSSDGGKARDPGKSESQARNPEHPKPPGGRDNKDRHREGHDGNKPRSDRHSSKDVRDPTEPTKTRGRNRSKEPREKDRSHHREQPSSRGGEQRRDSRQEPERHRHRSPVPSKERSTSRGHSQHKSRRSREHPSHAFEYAENIQPPEENVVKPAESHKKGSSKSKENASAPKDKGKRAKTGGKKKESERGSRSVQRATSTSEPQALAQAKSSKRSIRLVRSPSTSQTGETGDELELIRQPPAKQLPITVPATEMVVVQKPEKVKKKKKDKKVKTKGAEKEGTKVKKTKKKTGKGKKQKAAALVSEERPQDVLVAEIQDVDEIDPRPQTPVEEAPSLQEEEEASETTAETAQPEKTPPPAEPEKQPPEEAAKSPTEETDAEQTKDTRDEDKDDDDDDDDSSSDVEIVSGPVQSVYGEIIDLSQISSDEESYQRAFNKKSKDNNLYDPFEPTASPETISSPDVSERNAPQRRSQRSRDRSRSPPRRSNRSPLPRRSSPKRRSSPRRQRSLSPRRKSPGRQGGASKDRGYSSRKRSITPPRKSGLQKRRSPSPRRSLADRKGAHSPRKSPPRLSRRGASPKRHLSPRKRSMSPRGQSGSKRRRAESPRRRSPSPRRVAARRKQKPSPKKSISPRRRHVSPRRRSRSPRKRSVSPRQRSQRKRSPSPRRRNISPKRRKTSPIRRDASPRRRHMSPKKQADTRRQSISPRRRTPSPRRQDFSPPRRTLSGRRSMSSRSSSTSSRSSRSSRSLSSSSTWTSSSGSWTSSSYSRSPSSSRDESLSRSASPRRRRYSRSRSSSSFRSDSSYTTDRSSSPQQGTPAGPRSLTPKRSQAILHQSPTQTSSVYRHRADSEKTSPVQPRQDLPDSTQGSYRVAPSSPRSPDQTLAPATSTTDSHLASKATSQISHILGQLASNPAIQSALNSANLLQGGKGGADDDDDRSSDGSVSGFLKSSETSFTSPPSRPVEARQESEDKDLSSLADVNEDNIESSAVDLYNKNSRDRYLKKLQHQERVVEEVKLALKPYYQKREVNKDDYKEILRKSVNQVCHSKSGEINPVKIKKLIEGYIKKFRSKRKLDEKESSRPDLAFRLLTKS